MTKSRVQSTSRSAAMYSNFNSGLADPISWSAEASGFNRLTIEGLKADVGTTLTQDLSLVVGTIAEAIDVNGKTSLVETANGAIGTTFRSAVCSKCHW